MTLAPWDPRKIPKSYSFSIGLPLGHSNQPWKYMVSTFQELQGVSPSANMYEPRQAWRSQAQGSTLCHSGASESCPGRAVAYLALYPDPSLLSPNPHRAHSWLFRTSPGTPLDWVALVFTTFLYITNRAPIQFGGFNFFEADEIGLGYNKNMFWGNRRSKLYQIKNLGIENA